MHAPIPGEGATEHGPFLVFNSYLTSPCVPLFFMVSGALLLPCKEGITAGGYIKKRIGKIVGPTFCFSCFYMLLDFNDLWEWQLTCFQCLLAHKDMEFCGSCTPPCWFVLTCTDSLSLVKKCVKT